MSKSDRGTKRLCGECGKKFYDLGRDPIVCPVCETVFVVEVPAPKGRAAKESKPAAPVTSGEPKASGAPEAPEAAEVTKAAEPAATGEAAAAPEPEIISLDEAQAEETIDTPEVDDEELAALGGDDDDIPEADEDDVFLETDDEEGSDVTDIVPNPAKSGTDV